MTTLREYHDMTYKALDTDFSSWRSHWLELQQFILPRSGRFLSTDVNKGNKKNGSIIDNTGTLASRTLASGMLAGVTSPARPWFKLSTPDPQLREIKPVGIWLDRVANILFEIFAKSNTYDALHMLYGELGPFGTSPIIVVEDFQDVIRIQPLTIGSYRLATNERDEVDTMYRKIPMTLGAMVNMFGKNNLSDSARSLYEKKDFQQRLTVMHAIEPNTRRDISKIDNQNMPFGSYYWEEGSKHDGYLRKSGFHEKAMLAARWDVLGSDVYGRSPGMDALGDIKQLQTQHKEKGKAIAKQVNPPMVADQQLEGKVSNTLPGGVTYTQFMNGKPIFQPAYQVQFDLGALREDIVETQNRISRAFYEDLFLMMANSDRRQITATEVAERHEEKLLMLGPVMTRLNSELLNPLIDRTFNIAMRAGILPPPPQELENQNIKVEYISIMAQAQKLVGINSVERLAQYVINVGSVQPDVLDKFDFDQSVDEYSDMIGTPAKLVRSDEQVGAIRGQRQQQQQAQRAMDLAQQAMDVGQTASETKTSDGESALDRAADVLGS